jgi:hypothetical protein
MVLGLVMLSPAIVAAQDSVGGRMPPADGLKDWQRQQLAAAQHDDERRADARKRYEKKLKEIESSQSDGWNLIRSHIAKTPNAPTAWRVTTSDDLQLHVRHVVWKLAGPDVIGQDARLRRARLRDDDESAAQLNAARRAGDPQQIAVALEARRSAVNRFLADAESQLAVAKADLQKAKDLEMYFAGEDNPNLPSAEREIVRIWLRYFQRQTSALRALTDFEATRSSALRAEGSLLDGQLSAARSSLQRS